MKSLLFLLLFVPKLCISQTSSLDKKIFLDSIWKETTSENYQYYRIVKDYYTDKDLYLIKDYYKSGALQMEGLSLTKDYVNREGEYTFYFENRNKKTISNYSKSRLIGMHQEWYENGTKKEEGEYFESKESFQGDYKLYQFWNSDGKQTVIDGNGFYEDVDEDFSESGSVKDGLKDGVWKGEYNKKKKKYTEIYKRGELSSGESTDEDNNKYQYKVLENKPEPKKGIQHFYKYLAKNFDVPKVYQNLKGKIVTQFIVDKEGKITDVKTIKSLLPVLDQEAIRVISNYENWIPAKQRGQYVRVLYAIPISLSGVR